MAIYIIKDENDVEINRISASESFVSANFSNYERDTSEDQANAERAAREWRDSELSKTDVLASVSDYPHTTELTAYRTALRNWPSTSDFPDTRPQSLEDRIANA